MNDNYNKQEEVMSIGTWIGVLIVLGIPFVNIIMYLIWAISPNTNRNLSNFCKATIFLVLIGFGIALLFASCGAMMMW